MLDPRIALQAQGLNLEPRSNALARGMQLQGAQQQNALRQMQMQQIQAAMAQQAEQQQKAAAQEAALQQYIGRIPSPQAQARGALGTNASPTMANAQRMPQVDPRAQMLWQALQAGQVKPTDYIDEAYPVQEVARTVEVADGKGGKKTVQLDKRGNMVGQGLPGYIAPVQVNQGDKITFTQPTAGLSLPMGMSPQDRDASARGWAGVNLQRERLAFDKSKEGPAAKPSAAQERADIEKQKAGRQGEQMISAIESAKSLLDDGPTQSGVGSLIDAGGRMLGMSSESAQKAAQLETLSGWMVANVPRMEGPQSNFDIQNYQTMAAKVGDRSVPVSERRAALGTLEALHRKYAEINGTPLPAATFDADKEKRYQEWKRKQGSGQ